LQPKKKKMEEIIWIALRMFEERKNFLTTVAHEQKGATSRLAAERARLSQVYIDRIKAILLVDDKATTSKRSTSIRYSQLYCFSCKHLGS